MAMLDQPAGARLHDAADGLSVRRWFVFFIPALAAMAVPAVLLAAAADWTWADWRHDPEGTFRSADTALKLLVFALYNSLATTFLPIPTGWLVAGMATREAAIASPLASGELAVAMLTAGIVAAVGAAASTLANLTDYHLFTWLLRDRRIARVRRTRAYLAAASWFEASPFTILVLFNIIPIPVDVVRMLAATHRYPRVPFAAANFIGRALRYGVIAFVTFWWDLSWAAVLALLLVAVLLAAARAGPAVARMIRRRAAN